MIALSVISSSRQLACRRWRARVAATLSAKPGSIRLTGETFTDTCNLSPALRHSRCWRMAFSNTQAVTTCARPERSMTGMNSAGPTAPSSGWFQRSSASAPVQRLVATSMRGWYTRRNWSWLSSAVTKSLSRRKRRWYMASSSCEYTATWVGLSMASCAALCALRRTTRASAWPISNATTPADGVATWLDLATDSAMCIFASTIGTQLSSVAPGGASSMNCALATW